MIPSTAYAADTITCTRTEMEVGSLFARLLEDLHYVCVSENKSFNKH